MMATLLNGFLAIFISQTTPGWGKWDGRELDETCEHTTVLGWLIHTSTGRLR